MGLGGVMASSWLLLLLLAVKKSFAELDIHEARRCSVVDEEWNFRRIAWIEGVASWRLCAQRCHDDRRCHMWKFLPELSICVVGDQKLGTATVGNGFKSGLACEALVTDGDCSPVPENWIFNQTGWVERVPTWHLCALRCRSSTECDVWKFMPDISVCITGTNKVGAVASVDGTVSGFACEPFGGATTCTRSEEEWFFDKIEWLERVPTWHVCAQRCHDDNRCEAWKYLAELSVCVTGKNIQGQSLPGNGYVSGLPCDALSVATSTTTTSVTTSSSTSSTSTTETDTSSTTTVTKTTLTKTSSTTSSVTTTTVTSWSWRPVVHGRVAPGAGRGQAQDDGERDEQEVQAAEVERLLADVSSIQSSIFEWVPVNDDPPNQTGVVPGVGTVFAGRFGSLGKSSTMANINITLPDVLFAQALALSPPVPGDDLLFSAVNMEENTAAALGAFAAAVIELRWRSGSVVSTSGLPEPVTFSLPYIFNDTRATCAYWDNDTASWSTKGVTVSSGMALGEAIQCETTHFSLFGVILRAIVSTITCTNFDLLREGAISQLWLSPWPLTPGAILLEVIVASFAVFFIVAAVIDRRRHKQMHFNNEFFLVDVPPPPPSSAAGGSMAAGFAAATGEACLCCAGANSGAVGEALDDICSNWCEHFGEIRSVLEEVVGALASICESPGSFSICALMTKMTTTLMIHTSKRMTATSMGVSENLIAFVLEDKDFAEYMTGEHLSGRATESAGCSRLRTWTHTESQFEAWSILRTEVSETMLKHIRLHHRHSSLHASIGQLFLWRNPIADLFAFDIFQTCKVKVLLLTVDFFSAMTFCCVFFQGAGMVRGKPVLDEQMCDIDDEPSFGFWIGRFIVIASLSLLLANAPVMVLESLQTKCMATIPGGRASQAWKRQLRAWVIQERILWAVAIVFNCLFIFYILVFLANSSKEDHEEWTLVGQLSLVEDFLIFPLTIAIALPLLTKILLHTHNQVSTAPATHLTRLAGEDLHRTTNLMLPIEQL